MHRTGRVHRAAVSCEGLRFVTGPESGSSLTSAADRSPTVLSRPPWALVAIAGTLVVLLMLVSDRYGYHRDELYFIAAGGHPAWGYVDQPPLVPLFLHALNSVFGGSLVWLRLPSALAAGGSVVVCGLMAGELGDGRAAQLLAAGCLAVSAFLMAVGHLASTTTFDVLAWTVLSWLLIRGLKEPRRSWLPVGVVAGLALEVKTLVLFFLVAVLLGLAVVGPRRALRSRSLWGAALVALLFWAPNVWWQATHGWPQLALSSAIANGSSGSSQPRWAFLPFQLLLVSPLLVPVWLAGLWRLARQRDLATYRVFAAAYVLLALLFLATAGKPYYLAGLYPVLLAAGAAPTLRWASTSRPRRGLLTAGVAVTGVISAVLFLPVVPVSDLPSTPIVSVNYDAGETIGWTGYAATMTKAYRKLPRPERSQAAFLTSNYGEAGALQRFRPDLAPSYSGHNSYAEWGPPTPGTTTVVAVGFTRQQLIKWFATVRRLATVKNAAGVHNDEYGQAVWLCHRTRARWTVLWPRIQHYG
jgi:4-amino-4-deoxy-L-arabinose transferase-like glycosyltransferase